MVVVWGGQPSSSAHWLEKLVCTVALFTQCGMRSARGHPKGPILQHNNSRKSMKGQSDKVKINQLVDHKVCVLISDQTEGLCPKKWSRPSFSRLVSPPVSQRVQYFLKWLFLPFA